MSEITSNYLLSALLIFLWMITFIWYQRKNSRFDAGSFIIVMYIVYAIFSILTINDDSLPLLTNYKPLALFPYLYLYAMMMIAMSPSVYHHTHPTEQIDYPHTNILKMTSVVIIMTSILLLPGFLSDFNNGFLSIFTDPEAGKNAYLEQADGAATSGSAIRNLPAVIFNALSDIAVFLLFYYLTMTKKNRKLIIGLTFAVIISLAMPVVKGQRGGVVITSLTIMTGYFLFKQYLSKALTRRINKIGVVFLIIITLPVVAITISRFGTEKGDMSSFINWYVGQGNIYFNNHALDNGGLRYGDRTLNLFKRIVDSNTSSNYVERREKFSHIDINDEVFSTFVGDFAIDFGPFFAFVLFVIFNLWVIASFQKYQEDSKKIKIHQLLLLYFTVCVSIQGGMTLFSFSDSGNLRIITLMLLYSYLICHEDLLRKFPLVSNSSPEPPVQNDAIK